MSESHDKEIGNVLELVDQILEEQQYGGFMKEYESPGPNIPRELLLTHYDISSAHYIKLRNWQELANRIKNLPRAEYVDEITELKRDMDYLRLRYKALEKDVIHLKEENKNLSEQMQELQLRVETKKPTLSDLYKAFVNIVSKVDFVKQVLIEETIDVSTIWTIIDAKPFEDSLREPIYDAEINVLGML